jgi:hypothetical protein
LANCRSHDERLFAADQHVVETKLHGQRELILVPIQAALSPLFYDADGSLSQGARAGIHDVDVRRGGPQLAI